MNLKTAAMKTSPIILSALSVAGLMATVITAVKATPKAIKIIEEKKVTDPIDICRETWKCYVPSALLGIGTILCITGSNIISRQNQLNLVGAYTVVNRLRKEGKFAELSRHVQFLTNSEEKCNDIKPHIVRECCNVCTTGIDFPDKKVIWHEPVTDRCFEAYERDVMEAEYHLNRNYMLRGYVSLNDLNELLNLDWVPAGDTLGWSITDGIYWLDFEHTFIKTDDDGTDHYELSMIFPPDECYMDDWDYPHYDE